MPQMMMIAECKQRPELKCGLRSAECGVGGYLPPANDRIFAVDHKDRLLDLNSVHFKCPDRKRIAAKFLEIFITFGIDRAGILITGDFIALAVEYQLLVKF